MAPLLAEVQLALNERSADRVAAQLKDQMGDAGQKSGREFSDNFHRGIGGMRGMGQVAATEFRTGLRGGIDDAVRDFTSQFGAMGDAAHSVFGRIGSGGSVAALGVAGIGLAAVGVVQQLYTLGSTFDNITDTMALSTGKVGDSLDSLMATVREVGASAAAPLEVIGEVTGAVSQSLGLTGDQLAAMSKTLSEFKALSGQDIDTRNLGRLFSQFNIAPDQMMSGVDSLYAASVKTQTSMNEVIETMRKAGPAAKLAGLDFGQTAATLTALEEAGVDLTRFAPSMSSAFKQFAANGKEPAEGLRDTVAEIKNLIDAGHETEALSVAAGTFKKGYADLFSAIKDGRITVEDFNRALDNTNKISLQGTLDSTKDLSEQVTVLSNRLKTELAPAAEGVFNTLNKIGDFLGFDDGGFLYGSRDFFGNPIAPNQAPTGSPIDPGSALGQMLAPVQVGGGPSSPGLPAGFGLTNDDFGLSMSPFHPLAKDKSKTGLPAAPVVPLAGLPGLMPGLTPTSSLLGAQQAVAAAETKVAEAKARVLQLDGTNIATEQDRLKARNDLIRANQDKAQADLRFSEAQQSALKSQTKATEDASKKLGALGAQLDADFGASGGLPGILENATKALANLGFAPVLGALRGIQVANGFDQSDLGGGIIGALGATGAFGKQFVKSQDPYSPLSSGAGTAATSLNSLAAAANTASGALGGGGSGGGGGAYSSDAALLSNVPAGTYSQTQAADLTKGIGDCSSAVEDLVNIMDGRPTGGRSMSTGNAAEWLTSRGFLPGEGGPGDFRVGFSPSHMQATLPGGTPFNWGSDAAAARGGIGGTGADDPSFTDHWYRPMTTPMSSIPGLDGPLLSPSSAPSSPSAPGAASVPSTSGSDPLGLGLPTYGGLTSQQLTDPGLTPMPGGGSGGPRTSGLPRGLAPGFGIPGAPSILGMDPGGADPSQSVAGGRAFAQGVPASGGIGIGGGGLLGMLGSAAQSGIGLAASGAAMGMDGGAGGAVASAMAGIGIQEIQRAISAGGQYVGALAGGLLETFSLNDSALADPGKSWLGRIGVAVAGARPALPNSAGEMGGKENKNMAEGGKKPPGPMSPQQAKGGKGGQPGADGANGSNVGKGNGDTFNMSVVNNNNDTRFDPTHNDIQNMMSASQASRQPR